MTAVSTKHQACDTIIEYASLPHYPESSLFLSSLSLCSNSYNMLYNMYDLNIDERWNQGFK